ncbi:hypothetical protein BDV11DRAFT_200258, partial [Aspergillus similis]
MGLKFVVGYGPQGPHLRRWSPQAQGANFEDYFDSEEESTDGPDVTSGIQENIEQEDESDIDEPNTASIYSAIRTAFRHILSRQGGTFPTQPTEADSTQTECQEMDLWWWERCVL